MKIKHHQTNRIQTPSQIRFLKIFHRIRKRIALLDYPPGTRIEINKLAVEFDVSRTPIRSVLHRLEFEGLVVTNHGVGTMVTDIDISGLRSTWEFRARLAEMIGQLYPLSPSPKHLTELADLQELISHLHDDFTSRKFGEISLRFHNCIVSLVGHPQLARVYDELFYRSARMWISFLNKLNHEREMGFLSDDIDNVAHALKRNDMVAVGYIMRNTLNAVVWRLDELIGNEGGIN